jgi:hypothetical protein
MLFIVFLCYACSGYVLWAYHALTRKAREEKPPPAPAPDH